MRVDSQPGQNIQSESLKGRSQSVTTAKQKVKRELTTVVKNEDYPETLKLKYIEQVERQNNRLKFEIIRIREMIEQTAEKEGKKERSSILPTLGPQALKKELQNAYKLIKNYEKEIQSMEDKQADGPVPERITRLQIISKQKDDHIAKLKGELAGVARQSHDITKKLLHNAQKVQVTEQIQKLQQEMINLREKIRQNEREQKKKQQNAKKQYDYIKRIEKELIEGGVTTDQLQDMRKNNFYSLALDRHNNEVVRNNRGSMSSLDQLESAEKVQEIKKEIFLKRKLQFEYQRKIQKLNSDGFEQQRKLAVAKSLVAQRQNDINSLKAEIAYLKKNIDKANLKPLMARIQEEGPKPTTNNKLLRAKYTAAKSTINTHGHLKYDQKGVVTQKGQRFTDRNVLGRNFSSKIVGVKVWADKQTFSLCGIQCIYRVGSTRKVGGQHVKFDKDKKLYKDLYVENMFEVEDGDYIKNISGALSPTNTIEYIIFISSQTKVARYGVVKPTQKQFNFDIQETELPICMYGSLQIKSQVGKPDISAIEFLGFEITNDLKTPSHSRNDV